VAHGDAPSATTTIGPEDQTAGEQARPWYHALAFQRSAALAEVWRDALVPFLGTRLALLLVGLLGEFYLLPLVHHLPRGGVSARMIQDIRLPDALWLIWQREDSAWYLDIARNGYWSAASLHGPSNWVFYPLYPVLVRPVGFLLGGSGTAFDIAGVLVSNLAALIAVSYLYVLARRELGREVASLTVLMLALFPTSFYLSAVYSESVFLACCVACIYYTRTHRWWLAGFCGGLAALSHAQGILLVVPLAWEYWQALGDGYAPPSSRAAAPFLERVRAWLISRLRGPWLARRELHVWASLSALTLVPTGLVLFFAYAKLKTGDFLATYHNSHDQWGFATHGYLVYPWVVAAKALYHTLIRPQPADPLSWNPVLLNVVVMLVFLALSAWAFRKLATTYALYTVLMVVVPISTNYMQSIGRLYLAAFPAMMLIALWSSRGVRRTSFLIGLFASLQAAFMLFFVLALPIIA
jgi:Dolichyl-phosphate-mannose-protein mannosyltransferase